jgi:hypothetical protein
VDQAEYVAFLARAGRARTIAELHALAVEARASNPDDPDAGRIDDVCQMYAIDMMAALRRSAAHRPGEPRAALDYTERAYR